MAVELPPAIVIDTAVRAALAEDAADRDVTTLAVVDETLEGQAAFVARVGGIAAGLPIAARAFQVIDARVSFDQRTAEGSRFAAGDTLAIARGPVRALLQAERVALNFAQRLSAIATMTGIYVAAVSGTGFAILDTRKTTPGLRALEKYAVRCGGGTNHRSDLESMAMIKDNHREALARRGLSLADGVAAIRARTPDVPVEIEVDTLDDLDAALAAEPEWILLDNMTPDEMAEAVRRTARRAKLEASGGVTLDTVTDIARTRVDAISVGALTHSVKALDISLDLSF